LATFFGTSVFAAVKKVRGQSSLGSSVYYEPSFRYLDA